MIIVVEDLNELTEINQYFSSKAKGKILARNTHYGDVKNRIMITLLNLETGKR